MSFIEQLVYDLTNYICILKKKLSELYWVTLLFVSFYSYKEHVIFM